MDINSVAFLFLLRSYLLNWGRWGGGGGGGEVLSRQGVCVMSCKG